MRIMIKKTKVIADLLHPLDTDIVITVMIMTGVTRNHLIPEDLVVDPPKD